MTTLSFTVLFLFFTLACTNENTAKLAQMEAATKSLTEECEKIKQESISTKAENTTIKYQVEELRKSNRRNAIALFDDLEVIINPLKLNVKFSLYTGVGTFIELGAPYHRGTHVYYPLFTTHQPDFPQGWVSGNEVYLTDSDASFSFSESTSVEQLAINYSELNTHQANQVVQSAEFKESINKRYNQSNYESDE